ncbi:hypothetical protein M0R45_014984 [Rubus argutus]|uniref:DUF4283 domain-containing protein n=1 Tax=Rubus argutus TaxID=59490 RepID=A0AAW1XN39_RUBAR
MGEEELLRESERENGRGRVVTEGLKLKPRVFYVEFKSFFIELDTKSQGETIIITERSRSRNYKIGIGLGCAAWLIEQLSKVRGAGEQKVCKLFRGNNYNFWLEKYKNVNGAFLKLFQCGRNGFVQTIILPKGQREEGWQKLEDNLHTFMFGYRNKGLEQDWGYAGKLNLNGHVPHDHSKDIRGSLDKGIGVTGDNSQTSPSQLSKEYKDTWGCAVVCERQTAFQSWKCIEKCLSKWLQREVDLVPYQNNRAFFVCKNCEDVEMIVKQGKIPLRGQSEVLLYEWADALMNNLKKVVSYGGWIAVKGLPLHWWSTKFFKRIGDACGGLLEVDKRTEKLKHLYEARIKVTENETGLLPELIKLSEDGQSYIVRIQPLSKAIQPLNIRRREQHFQLLCAKKISKVIEVPPFGLLEGLSRNRNRTDSSPATTRGLEDQSSNIGETRGHIKRKGRQMPADTTKKKVR